MKNQIHLACLALEEALIADLERRERETEVQREAPKTRNNVLLAKDVIRDIEQSLL